ncbi:MAG TPA: hypothetical protein VFV20_04230 [Candidatus Limnocylindria bacterium]|nr:hypothetical protein [Candidatus Limnocylindria bacterium]
MRPPSLWLLGFAVGIAGIPMASYVAFPGMIVLGLLALALVRSRSVALFGGLSLAVGAWFSFLEWRTVANCDAFNRRGGGSCTIIDPAPSVLIPLLFLALGVALSAYGLLRDRPREAA